MVFGIDAERLRVFRGERAEQRDADPLRVGRLSQDFAWFSPVLKRDLAGKRGDIAVCPRTEAEIRQVVAACASAGIPLTVRGSGTGNYGQSTPLHGGVILDLSGYNAFGWVRGGVGRAQSGIRLADFDAQAKPHGQELRWLPSTYRSATLGGLFGGGFGGAGSINHGPLAAPGNVLAVRAITVAPSHRSSSYAVARPCCCTTPTAPTASCWSWKWP